MSARYIIGDVFEALESLPDNSVDLVFSSPPFLALRSYLPADHPLKDKEIGSEATPADFLDTLLDVVEACDRVLAPHGSLCFELGDTFAGSGGAGGDYKEGAMRDGQPVFVGSAYRELEGTKGRKIQRDDHEYSLPAKPAGGFAQGGGAGWPLPKSLCGIPTLFAWSLAYGRNLLRPERTTPRWRIRNVVVWARPNPPVGALGDKFRCATSYLTVACKSDRRWFDLDAVRHPLTRPEFAKYEPITNRVGPGRVEDGMQRSSRGSIDAGAPPLDYWEIPTAPSSGEGTSRRLRVPLDGLVGGIQRTTSADCPEHGSQGRQGSSAEHGGREAAGSIRTPGTDARRAPTPQAEPPPTFWNTDQTDDAGSLPDPAATSHSNPSSRTAPAPETSSPGTPSAQTTARTERTSGSPESSDSGSNTDENRTEDEAGSAADLQRTVPRTDHSSPSSACTCSHYVEVDAAEPSRDYAGIPGDLWVIPTHPFPGSHYATWPPALCVKPIKSMTPQRVCRVCGEPSRRITGDAEYVKSDGSTYDTPNAGWSNPTWDSTVPNRREASGADNGNMSRVAPTLGWTDCGCSVLQACEWYESDWPCGIDCGCTENPKWRVGVVLDPFAGSGTTLSVATGHGRDAIGIDIDERNAELALERVGPLFLTVETLERMEPFAPPAEDVQTDAV